jgi:hypothetical protein
VTHPSQQQVDTPSALSGLIECMRTPAISGDDSTWPTATRWVPPGTTVLPACSGVSCPPPQPCADGSGSVTQPGECCPSCPQPTGGTGCDQIQPSCPPEPTICADGAAPVIVNCCFVCADGTLTTVSPTQRLTTDTPRCDHVQCSTEPTSCPNGEVPTVQQGDCCRTCSEPPCTCPTVASSEQVCGSDGVTYPSECLAVECAHVTVRNQGHCESTTPRPQVRAHPT